jgi:penicillin-binding protein 1C
VKAIRVKRFGLMGVGGVALIGAFIGLPVSVELASYLLPPPELTRFRMPSPSVLDGEGALLRAYLAGDERWRLVTTPSDLTSTHREILLAYEDKRFYRHYGVDHLALARAGWQLVRHRRVVSGASTITMQVARLLDPRPTGVWTKFTQMAAARQLERSYSKEQILTFYLTLIPFGGNLESVRAAALSYFGKEPGALSVAEVALLVSLPQAPEARRPDRVPKTLSSARDRVVKRMLGAGLLTSRAAARARRLPPPARGTLTFAAAHLSDRLLPRAIATGRPLRTFISSPLQRHCEKLALSVIRGAPPGVNAAILVVRNTDRAVVAYVGGADYNAQDRAGQVDLIQASRSPGSTLKPLIYGMAFEDRLLHPATIVTDAPNRFGTYEPENFLAGYAGEVTARIALTRSFNTIAVSLLAEIGPQRLLSRFRAAGVPLKLPQADNEAGLAIALGGGGFSLFDLVTLYGGLADRGHLRKLRIEPTEPTDAGYDILPTDAAWAIADILADVPPPPGFGVLQSKNGSRRVAYKTGTSFGFRDALAVGFDDDYTVGVWIGRPDGAPTPDAYGITTAAPVLYRVFDRLPSPTDDVAGWRPGPSILTEREVPERLQRFQPRADKGSLPLAILFPAEGSTLQVGNRDGGLIPLPLSISGGVPPYHWYADDKIIFPPTSDRVSLWVPPGAGATTLRVFDSAGRRAETTFWIDGKPHE